MPVHAGGRAEGQEGACGSQMAEFPTPVRFELVEDVAHSGDAKPHPGHNRRRGNGAVPLSKHLPKHPN